MSELRARAEAWIEQDPDPATRAELEALLEDPAELEARFGDRLPFGTAGIRGPLGAGPARMNRVVVRRVTAGVGAHLLAAVPDAAARGVVVGRDARHGSREFATDAAGVLAAAGLRVYLFDDPVPTPLLAFAVRRLNAAAGVQVTASHNPATDNGYKVYWEDGVQIAPPLDSAISDAIDVVDGPPAVADLGHALISSVADDIWPAYVAAGLAAVPADGRTAAAAADLRIAYTPLHGVALDLLRGMLHAGGFRDLYVVGEQERPDPDFPTVGFPNPEEPGALDLVLALADEVDADLVLANDPDGDRIAVAVPTAQGWRTLSGDETGCLLAEHLLARHEGSATVATTVVSSSLLARIAERHAAAYEETLTGFKWLAREAAPARAEGRPLVLAYEQALGVMVGDAVLDKDGIVAALAVADLAARQKARGAGLTDLLDALARRHGLHVTAGRSVRLDDADTDLVSAALRRLREGTPDELAGVEVSAVDDRSARVRRHPDGHQEPLTTPATELVGLHLADGSRAQLRPSGTEPLLKAYGEVVEEVGEGEPVAAAHDRAEARLTRLLDALLATAGVSASASG